MRILFIAAADSIHTARWLSQLADEGWDIHLFPVNENPLHPDLRDVTVYPFFRDRSPKLNASVRQTKVFWPLPRGSTRARLLLERLSPRLFDRSARLTRLIRSLKPNVVHTLEMQAGGYLTIQSRKQLGRSFPPWLFSSWGSDIFYFGQQPEHEYRIREVLSACDYYIPDCQRDVSLAKEFGFKGEVLGVFPAVGGFDIQGMRRFRQAPPTSSRRVIALKGYHDDKFVGRALVALEALRLCANSLAGYEVVIYSSTPDVRRAGLRLSESTALPVTVMPYSPHEEVVKLMGRTRIAIGVSTADGTPLSMLEAMVMGAFPVQSDTISTAEWIAHGNNGLLVPPEDPGAIAEAIEHAATNDVLVDHADAINAKLTAERLDRSVIQPRIVDVYRKIAARVR